MWPCSDITILGEFKSSSPIFCSVPSQERKTRLRKIGEKSKVCLFRLLWLTSFSFFLFPSIFLGCAIWRHSASGPIYSCISKQIPVAFVFVGISRYTFAIFHFLRFLALFAFVLTFGFLFFFSCFSKTVYVFLGEPHNLYDFMTTMQMMRLFTNGEYMVVSVDWETYSSGRAREYLWSWVVYLFFYSLHQLL